MTKKDWLVIVYGLVICFFMCFFIYTGIKNYKRSQKVSIADSVAVDSTTVDTVAVKTEKIETDSSYWNSRKGIREAYPFSRIPKQKNMCNVK